VNITLVGHWAEMIEQEAEQCAMTDVSRKAVHWMNPMQECIFASSLSRTDGIPSFLNVRAMY
jgi:hypothetical protein